MAMPEENAVNKKPEASPEDKEYILRRKILVIASLVVVVGLFVWLTVAVGGPLIKFASNPELFREWIDAAGVWGRFVFLGLQVLQVVVAMIPGEVLEIGAGYAFGAIEGTLLCLVGTALGTMIIYLLTKKIGVKMVEVFVSREKMSEFKLFKDARKLNTLLFVVFFIPGTPKDLFTYFAGLTPVKLGTLLLITSVARIPSVISSTFGGNALGEQNYTFAIVIFVITAAVSLAGLILYNVYQKRKASGAKDDNEPKKP